MTCLRPRSRSSSRGGGGAEEDADEGKRRRRSSGSSSSAEAPWFKMFQGDVQDLMSQSEFHLANGVVTQHFRSFCERAQLQVSRKASKTLGLLMQLWERNQPQSSSSSAVSLGKEEEEEAEVVARVEERENVQVIEIFVHEVRRCEQMVSSIVSKLKSEHLVLQLGGGGGGGQKDGKQQQQEKMKLLIDATCHLFRLAFASLNLYQEMWTIIPVKTLVCRMKARYGGVAEFALQLLESSVTTLKSRVGCYGMGSVLIAGGILCCILTGPLVAGLVIGIPMAVAGLVIIIRKRMRDRCAIQKRQEELKRLEIEFKSLVRQWEELNSRLSTDDLQKLVETMVNAQKTLPVIQKEVFYEIEVLQRTCSMCLEPLVAPPPKKSDPIPCPFPPHSSSCHHPSSSSSLDSSFSGSFSVASSCASSSSFGASSREREDQKEGELVFDPEHSSASCVLEIKDHTIIRLSGCSPPHLFHAACWQQWDPASKICCECRAPYSQVIEVPLEHIKDCL